MFSLWKQKWKKSVGINQSQQQEVLKYKTPGRPKKKIFAFNNKFLKVDNERFHNMSNISITSSMATGDEKLHNVSNIPENADNESKFQTSQTFLEMLRVKRADFIMCPICQEIKII